MIRNVLKAAVAIGVLACTTAICSGCASHASSTGAASESSAASKVGYMATFAPPNAHASGKSPQTLAPSGATSENNASAKVGY
jgi:hypothetical protein